MSNANKELNFKKKPCQDHLGNKFDSMSEMCEHYNITVSAFQNRRRHYSLEVALTCWKQKKNNKFFIERAVQILQQGMKDAESK